MIERVDYWRQGQIKDDILSVKDRLHEDMKGILWNQFVRRKMKEERHEQKT